MFQNSRNSVFILKIEGACKYLTLFFSLCTLYQALFVQYQQASNRFLGMLCDTLKMALYCLFCCLEKNLRLVIQFITLACLHVEVSEIKRHHNKIYIKY